jgi:hypothetical protein
MRRWGKTALGLAAVLAATGSALLLTTHDRHAAPSAGPKHIAFPNTFAEGDDQYRLMALKRAWESGGCEGCQWMSARYSDTAIGVDLITWMTYRPGGTALCSGDTHGGICTDDGDYSALSFVADGGAARPVAVQTLTRQMLDLLH